MEIHRSFEYSRVVTGPGGVAFDPVTGARRRRWVNTWLLSWQSWNGIHSQLFCPGQGYRQCPPPPYSMIRWWKNQHQKNIQILLNVDSPSSTFWQYFRCPINFLLQVEERRSSKTVTPQASFDNMDSDSDEDEERERGHRKRVNLPPMRQKLTGHRNARTMIKVTASMKILTSVSNSGSSVVGEGLHLLWFRLRPPLCLGSQHWRVRHYAWGRQVQQLETL